jgi:hypothetical protein
VRSLVARSAPAIVLAVGAIMLGHSATAYAAPEWDIELYDSCLAGALADYQLGKRTLQQYEADVKNCCVISDGVLSETQGCGAPPANAVGRTVRPGAIQQTLTPAQVGPPPGDITQAFTPAP